MRVSNDLLRFLRGATSRALTPRRSPFTSNHCQRRQPLVLSGRVRNASLQKSQRRYYANPADRDDFVSVLDNPPQLISTRRKHGPGIFVLAAIPITAFLLGCWQVQRLGWKTELIARFEDRLVQPPLPLPPTVDPNAIHDFDYRRVYTTGRYRHDQEMLIGPRLHDGADGFLVVTPLEREGGSKILVNRGWISKERRGSRERALHGLPRDEVTVQGLLREPWKKNLFTPENRPERNEWYFPDVESMARVTGSTPVWIETTMQPDLIMTWDREQKGIPIGRPAEVNLRNNHTQYIFTWFSLSLATTIMLGMVLKRPPRGAAARVRKNIEW